MGRRLGDGEGVLGQLVESRAIHPNTVTPSSTACRKSRASNVGDISGCAHVMRTMSGIFTIVPPSVRSPYLQKGSLRSRRGSTGVEEMYPRLASLIRRGNDLVLIILEVAVG